MRVKVTGSKVRGDNKKDVRWDPGDRHTQTPSPVHKLTLHSLTLTAGGGRGGTAV